MKEERDELKKDLLSKNEPELRDLENSQPLHIAKTMRKHVLKKIPRIWLHYDFIKFYRIIGAKTLPV